MIGQGRPRSSRAIRTFAVRAAALIAIVLATTVDHIGAGEPPTIRARLVWGGSQPERWHGTVVVHSGTLANLAPLGFEADEPGSMWLDAGVLTVREPTVRTFDGVDLDITAPLDATLVIDLSSDGSDTKSAPIEVPISKLLKDTFSAELDSRHNRLTIARVPGDLLQVKFDRDSLVFVTGQMLKADVTARLLPVDTGTRLRYRITLRENPSSHLVWSNEIEAVAPGKDDLSSASIPVECPLPMAEGVYDLDLEVTTKRLTLNLGLTHTIAQRRVQLVVISDQPRPAADDAKVTPTPVMEIDPSKPNWWGRFALKAPFGSDSTHPWQHSLGPLLQLGPGRDGAQPGWEAFPLSVSTIGQPYVVEIEYPSDVPQTVGVSIVEPDSAGELAPIGLDTGFYVPEEAATGKAVIRTHRVVFWPRTKSPLLLITNCRSGSQVVFGKIRVLSYPGHLPAAFPLRESPAARLLAGYFDRPLFPENFSAPQTLDTAGGRSLDDWNTFYLGAARLVDYLSHVGYNGVMLSVMADASTIYPSAELQSTPRYDSGVFFSNGQDPVRKDVLELVLRLFDRENLRLIPALSFSTPLPKLEELKRRDPDAAVGIEWIGRDGAAWRQRHGADRKQAPYYNSLDPRVQEAMLAIVDELLIRYAKHESFAGLGLQLSANGFAQLPGLAWGFDDRTIERFTRDTGIRVAAQGPRRYASRASELLGTYRKPWADWRTAQLTAFYQRIQERLRAARPGAKLYLAGAELFNSAELQDTLRPTLPPRPITEALLGTGVDPEIARKQPGIVLLRPQYLSPPGPLGKRLVDLKINDTPELDSDIREAATPGSLFFHEPQRLALPSFDAKSPFRNSRLRLTAQISPSGERNRQRFTHSMATLDADCMFDGGWMLPLGQEVAATDLVAAYRRLPVGKYATVPLDTQPVTVRTCVHDKQTYLYLVNDSPWPAVVKLDLASNAGFRLTELTGRRPIKPVDARATTANWTVELEPYDLLAVVGSTPDLHVTDTKVELPQSVEAELGNRIQDFQARAIALQTQPPLDGLQNPDFDLPLEPGGSLSGWSVSSSEASSMTLDRQQTYHGPQALKLSSEGPPTIVVSNPFSAPATGRLEVSLWLRSDNTEIAAPLKLAVEGTHDGEPFYRRVDLMAGPRSNSEWTQQLASFDNLPLDNLSTLKLRLELLGRGEVWVDNLELHHLHFKADERVELFKLGTSAQLKLKDGHISDCLRLLEGYWPQFLIVHVPLTEGPVAQRPPERQAALPAERPTAEKPAKTGLRSRIREYLPTFLR